MIHLTSISQNYSSWVFDIKNISKKLDVFTDRKICLLFVYRVIVHMNHVTV